MGMLHGEFAVVDGRPAAQQQSEPAASSVQSDTVPAQSAPQTSPPPAAERTYKVRRGDTLSGIAKRLYGDEKRWRDIAAANPALNPKRLRAGQIINVPTTAQP